MATSLGRVGFWCFWVSDWLLWVDDLVISEVWLGLVGLLWLSWIGWLAGDSWLLDWHGWVLHGVVRLVKWSAKVYTSLRQDLSALVMSCSGDTYLLSWASWLLERVGRADLLVLADRSALGADRLSLSSVSGSVDSCLRLHVDGLDGLLNDRGVRLLESGRVGPWQLRLDGSTDVRINQDGREVCRGDGLYNVSGMQPKAGECSHTSTFWVLVLISVSY